MSGTRSALAGRRLADTVPTADHDGGAVWAAARPITGPRPAVTQRGCPPPTWWRQW